MADSFSNVTTTPYVELVPPNKTRTVYIVTAQADPSGVVFFVPVVKVDLAPARLDLILGTLAEVFNTLADKPGVESITVEQGLNAANVLQQRVVVGVVSSSGDSDTTVTLKWGEAQDQRGYAKIAAARAQLDDIEGL